MNWENKNILITGISGFVAPYLAKELIAKNANVFGLKRKKANECLSKNLIPIKNDIKIIEGDLIDITSIMFALDESTPDMIYHLGSQSYIPNSFTNPIETFRINSLGTANLLEAVRIKNNNPKIIFAGSSEEYGLVISSEIQYEEIVKKYGKIFPQVEKIPELPIEETNPLRPMSPYAISKINGEYLMRGYHYSYGLKTITSRAFNHEGAGRGLNFVTSVIANQIAQIELGNIKKIRIGNVNAFRDWSHVKDIINGYLLLGENNTVIGKAYNLGSMRTNSVLTYILLCIESTGRHIKSIVTLKNNKTISFPSETSNSEIFGIRFKKSIIDDLILRNEIEFDIKDKGILVHSDRDTILIEFDDERFRPADVPILLSNNKKISELGFKVRYDVKDIIKDQLNYFMNIDNQ